MKINKWLEASLFKEYLQDVMNATHIYFFTESPIATTDIRSTMGSQYWTDNALDGKVLMDIALSPTESWDIGSDNLNLDAKLEWKSTNRFTPSQNGTANWFLITDNSKNVFFMGEVSGPDGTGDMIISNNVLTTDSVYKLYNYVLTYEQL